MTCWAVQSNSVSGWEIFLLYHDKIDMNIVQANVQYIIKAISILGIFLLIPFSKTSFSNSSSFCLCITAFIDTEAYQKSAAALIRTRYCFILLYYFNHRRRRKMALGCPWFLKKRIELNEYTWVLMYTIITHHQIRAKTFCCIRP